MNTKCYRANKLIARNAGISLKPDKIEQLRRRASAEGRTPSGTVAALIGRDALARRLAGAYLAETITAQELADRMALVFVPDVPDVQEPGQ